MDKKWYIVHAYSNFERKVADSIKEKAVATGLGDLFDEILVPTEKVVEVRRGRKVDAERKFFPGYVLVKMTMTDEAFHHKFGKIWADRTLPNLTREEHDKVEDWAAHVFESLLFNLTSISQRPYIYEEFGLDPKWVRDAIRERFGSNSRKNSMKESTNIFRVLVKTLMKAGIITDRTRHVYSPWLDMDELAGEGDSMVGDAIAADGIEFLREINRKRRVIGQKLVG